MKPIFLIGLPGCGKTTLGRALARKLKLQFYDLDHYIEARFRTTVPEMFDKVGEEEFRRREAVMLREIGEMEDVVVACGGGTPCHHDNMEYMNSRGATVWLQASEPVLTDRIIRAKGRRPMFAGCKGRQEVIDRLRKTETERTPVYSSAHYRFNGDELENQKMIDSSVARFIEEINP